MGACTAQMREVRAKGRGTGDPAAIVRRCSQYSVGAPMKHAWSIPFCIALVGCAQAPEEAGASARIAELERTVEQLQKQKLNEIAEKEERDASAPPQAAPTEPVQRFELIADGLAGERRLYRSLETCNEAKAALEAAADEREQKSREQGAVYVSPYKAACIPV